MKKLIFAFLPLFALFLANPTNTMAYDPSSMMPVPKICPSGFSYYTACQQYGMGCEPFGCQGSDAPIGII
jgi:hypothetical protein